MADFLEVYMKKFITIILSLLLMLQFSIVAYAKDATVVYADAVSLSKTEETLIPVKIKDNSGIMGFKISVEYPVDKIDITFVSRGEVASKGNFNTNFGINDGAFDVLWNNTEEIKIDGTLFFISAKAKEEIKKDVQIKLSFSQPDTFNEKYEDVTFKCENITVSAKYIESTSEQYSQNDREYTTALSSISNSQILDAVKITLKQNNCLGLNDVKDKEKFIKDFNKNLESITSSSEHNVTDFDTIKSMYNSAYEGEFVTKITNNIDGNRIQATINETLEEYNVKSVDELSEKDKSGFVKKFEKKMKEQDQDIPSISEELDTNDAINIIDKLNSLNTIDKRGKNDNKKFSKITIIIVIIVIVLIFAGLVIIVFKKKKHVILK